MKSGNRNGRYVEIMDTTLRDGEQTPGVAFTPAEKLGIVRLLINHLHLDRMEIGSARVSEGEKKAITDILTEHCGSCWSLNSHTYERETGLFHWEWTFEVED